jgi:hypothetical protein
VPARICNFGGADTPRGGRFATASAIRSHSGRSFFGPAAAGADQLRRPLVEPARRSSSTTGRRRALHRRAQPRTPASRGTVALPRTWETTRGESRRAACLGSPGRWGRGPHCTRARSRPSRRIGSSQGTIPPLRRRPPTD